MIHEKYLSRIKVRVINELSRFHFELIHAKNCNNHK